MLLQQLEQQVQCRFISCISSRNVTRQQVHSAGVQNEPLNRALADLRQML
jgi:hypothetical protein